MLEANNGERTEAMNADLLLAAARTLSSLVLAISLIAVLCGALFGLVCIRLSTEDERVLRWDSIWRPYLEHSAYIGCVAVLGMVTGILAGNSRTAVIGDVLPATLSLVGALVAVFLTRESEYRRLALALALSLSVSTMLGAILGSHMREQTRNSEQAIEQRANLVAFCKLQELRANQMIALLSGTSATGVDLKCADYPRE